MLLLAALATACPKRAPQPSAGGGSMIAHLTEERRSEVFELNLKKTERVLIEGNAGAGHEAPSLSLSLGGKVVNDDTMLGDAEGQSWLDVLAPEAGTYTLSVSFDTPESWGDVAVKVWNDRDRPASRTGEFQLASIDDQRARLVDVSRLQRTGQTIRAPLIEVVVEVGALEEPADPAFELTLRRLPGESGVPRDPARIGRVDLERLIAESAQGRAAKSSLDSTRAAAQQRVDAEKTALRQNPNDPARRQALEKQLIRYETTMKSEERRWHERLLELFGERAAALAWKLDLDLVVSGDQPALKGVPVQDLTAAVMDGPVEPLKPYAGSAQVRIFYFDEETAALTGGSWAAVEARAKPYTLIRGSSVVWSRSGYDVTYERKETPGR